MTTVNAFKKFCVDVHGVIKKKKKIKLEMHKYIKTENFDVLNDKEGVYLVSLASDDHNTDHCMTILGD